MAKQLNSLPHFLGANFLEGKQTTNILNVLRKWLTLTAQL